MRKLNRIRPWIVACLLVVLAACGRTVGERFDDTTITTRVKTAILNDPQIGARSIDVATQSGVVTLSGAVRNQAERQQAVALARRVDGVAEVRDTLQVAPPD
jgi:osmotically-inducible protein OsmY